MRLVAPQEVSIWFWIGRIAFSACPHPQDSALAGAAARTREAQAEVRELQQELENNAREAGSMQASNVSMPILHPGLCVEVQGQSVL